MKKILLISPHYPLPEDNGGSIRTMNFVRFFQKYGAVDLACFSFQAQKVDNSPFGKEIILQREKSVGEKQGTSLDIKMGISRLLSRRPWFVSEWSKENEHELLSLIIKEHYDLILCRYISPTLPLLRLPKRIKRKVIIDFDDIVSDSLYAAFYGGGNKFISKLKIKLDKTFLKEYEKRCLNFGAALFCSNADLNKVARKKNKSCFVVPNTYPISALAAKELDDGYEKRNSFLFVGGLGYKPNITGLKWFIQSVLPSVRGKYKETKLVVVGHGPYEKIRDEYGSYGHIQIYPNVPDVTPFYRECGIVVVPILSGGGTRIKILEAGMFRRPVLSTPLGAYGLEVCNGKDLLFFNDEQTFLSQLNSLNNRAFYNSLVQNLEQIVRQHYSATAFNSAMEKVMKRYV